MDSQPQISKNVIDRRGAATHGFAALVGMILGFLGHAVASPQSAPQADDSVALLASAALDRGQDFWRAHLPSWRDARVVLFRDREQTPCGLANDVSGPFYCDGRIYLDLSFLGSIPGDLARAYVVEHELGHHVAATQGWNTGGVHDELLADCLAGRLMRAEEAAGHLKPGDLDDALAEAEAIGDDRLCPSCPRETWTHGSSAQRRAALARGHDSGNCL